MPESSSHIVINLTLDLFLLTQIRNTKKRQMRSQNLWHFKAYKTGAYLKTKIYKKRKKSRRTPAHTPTTKADSHINKQKKE